MMDRTFFFQEARKNAEKALELMKEKNPDYALEHDPFSNFRGGEIVGVTVEQAIALRMVEKIIRVGNMQKNGGAIQTKKENPVEDDLLDLMNYANILLVYRTSKAL